MKPTLVVRPPLASQRRRAPRARLAGMTLVELMVTLAVVTIVAGLGVPSFLRLLARHAIAAQADELQDAVRLGRSEAMKRGGPVVLCRTAPEDTSRCAGTGGNWQTWLLFTDVARTGTFVAGDAVVRQHPDVSTRLKVAGSASSIRFESTGIAHADDGRAAFTLSPAGSGSGSGGGDRAAQRQVCVNPRGEVVVIAGADTCP